MSHIAIWEDVCTTDPRYTKEFSRSGGFKGTAINPTYQIMKATELFGPAGWMWGWDIAKEDYVPGAESEVNHVVRLNLWYLVTPRLVKMVAGDDQEMIEFLTNMIGSRCVVTHYGQTIFVGKNKYGAFTDEEAPKKSLTDAISKCLSCIGVSADIHLGLYDSNKYVNDRKAEFAGEKTAAPKNIEQERANRAKMATEFEAKLNTLTDETEVRRLFPQITAALNIMKDSAEFDEWADKFRKRVAKLKAPKEIAHAPETPVAA